MNRCSPFWRCLRYGCRRCDRERERDASRREGYRKLEDAIRERRNAADERAANRDDPRLN